MAFSPNWSDPVDSNEHGADCDCLSCVEHVWPAGRPLEVSRRRDTLTDLLPPTARALVYGQRMLDASEEAIRGVNEPPREKTPTLEEVEAVPQHIDPEGEKTVDLRPQAALWYRCRRCAEMGQSECDCPVLP